MLERLIHLLESLHAWINLHPYAGVLVFAALFVTAQACMIPVAPLALAAGFFFGFVNGWLALWAGCLIGAMLNFWISRKLARNWVQKRLGTHEKFRMLDAAIAAEGWKIVALLRFVPIPFGLANYLYGLTRLHFVPYLLATAFAIIPANSLFVWMGSRFQGELSALLGKGRPHHPLEYVFLVVGVVAAVLVLRYISRVANRAVERSGGSAGSV